MQAQSLDWLDIRSTQTVARDSVQYSFFTQQSINKYHTLSDVHRIV